jgi:hypothetical protein
VGPALAHSSLQTCKVSDKCHSKQTSQSHCQNLPVCLDAKVKRWPNALHSHATGQILRCFAMINLGFQLGDLTLQSRNLLLLRFIWPCPERPELDRSRTLERIYAEHPRHAWPRRSYAALPDQPHRFKLELLLDYSPRMTTSGFKKHLISVFKLEAVQ